MVLGEGPAVRVAAGLAESLGRKTLVIIQEDERGGGAPWMDQESLVSKALFNAYDT